MDGPKAAGLVTRLITCHTAEMTVEELGAVRALLDKSFDDYTDDDWGHGLGGTHVLVVEGSDDVIAHGSLVMRRLLHEGMSLRAGYVEGVAVRTDRRRAGHATTVMEGLERLAPAYDLLALSASDAGVTLYESRGWQRWRGPTSVLTPTGIQWTPDEDGSVFVLLGATAVDLEAGLTCDWRPGDVW